MTAARSPSRPPPASSAGPAPTRGLTVLAPWATLLVTEIAPGIAIKPVENRTWATEFRGIVAIHEGTSLRELDSDDLEQWLSGLHPDLDELLHLPLLPGDDPKRPKISSIFHPGCIIGTVEIFDCIGPFGDNPGELDIADFEQLCRDRGHGAWYDSHPIPPAEFASGTYCHLTRNPRQFTQPIKATGALNYWYLDNPRNPGLPAAVAAALRRPLGSPYHYRAKIAATRKPA